MRIKDLFFREDASNMYTEISFVQVKNSKPEYQTIEMPCSMAEIIAILLRAKDEMTKSEK